MPAFKDLTRKEKLLKSACVGGGFVAGLAVGGTITDAMRKGGWGEPLSSMAGLALTYAYTMVFSIAADTAIVSNRENKIREINQLTEAKAAIDKYKASEDKLAGEDKEA